MTAEFILAIKGDIPELLSMMQELYEYDHSSWSEDTHRRALELLIAEPSYGRIWRIVSESQTVGYVILTFGFSLEFHGRDGLIDELYIREPFRGKGLGTQALAFAEQTARDLGIHAVHLEVAHSNARAQEVYRKSGYYDHDRYFMTKWLIEKP